MNKLAFVFLFLVICAAVQIGYVEAQSIKTNSHLIKALTKREEDDEVPVARSCQSDANGNTQCMVHACNIDENGNEDCEGQHMSV